MRMASPVPRPWRPWRDSHDKSEVPAEPEGDAGDEGDLEGGHAGGQYHAEVEIVFP